MICNCNNWHEISSGGLTAGASATITVEQVEGGVICGGSAVVDMPQYVYDGMAGVWPLNETGNGTIDEYKDRSQFKIHGTGGEGLASRTPSSDNGVFCLSAANFNSSSSQYISFPADSIKTTGTFTVSAWIKLENKYFPRMIFSRGCFSIGYSFLNHLVANLKTENNDAVISTDCYSLETMQPDKFYHVAATYNGSSLSVYINGNLSNSVSISGSTAEPTMGYHGRWASGGYHYGLLQEVRLHSMARNSAWLQAEHSNFCNGNFYSIGDEEIL
ncbi:MAG: LamG domain-containing protein [Pirellulaceae bacterium]